MKYSRVRLYSILFVLVISTISVPIISGCQKEKEQVFEKTSELKQSPESEIKVLTDHNDKNSLTVKLEQTSHYAEFLPLSFETADAVLTSNTPFSYISINYSNTLNPDPDSPFRDSIDLCLSTGYTGTSVLYNTIESFRGSLNREFQTSSPPVSQNLERTFSSSQIELILDYLLAVENQDYFFNAEEYEGLDIPYEARGVHLKPGFRVFTLSIYEPESKTSAWTMSKRIDDPDPIMQGLIDILEEHFIDEFE